MKLKLLLIVVCLSFNVRAIAQVKFGFELNAYSSTLKNISPDTIVPYGLSGAKVKHSLSYGIAPAFVLRKDIGKKFSLETGIGYWSDKYNLHLHFFNRFLSKESDTTLNISLKYIQVPVLLNYCVPINETTSFLISGGFKTKTLIYQKDNYQDIIYELIGFSADFSAYKRIVLASSLAIALNRQVSKDKNYELSLFGNMDATPFVKGPDPWGFYENLYNARSLQSGISLKLFL